MRRTKQSKQFCSEFVSCLFFLLLLLIMVDQVDENVILTIGLNFLGFNPYRTQQHSVNKNKKHFEHAFGASTKACCALFNDLKDLDLGAVAIEKPKLTHFLLALHWLRRYPTEEASSGLSGLDEDTVRKWVWRYCIAIQALKAYKVSFCNICIKEIIF